MPLPYERTTYDGKPVDWMTRAFLEELGRALGYGPNNVSVTQGSYSAGRVKASGGTHDGGGVVDLPPFEAERKEYHARKLGAFAYVREEVPGLWSKHVHLGILDHARLSDSARDQQAEYLRGGDALVGDRPDTGPRQFVNNRFRFPEELLPPISLSRVREQFLHSIADEKLTTTIGVRKIQRRLNARYGVGLKVDGLAGDVTRAAWRKHERATDHVAGRVGVPDHDSLVNLMRGYAHVID